MTSKKTLLRINETEKLIEARSYDIRTKQTQLDDTEREIARIKELNSGTNVEIIALRKDVDRVSSDCYDLRKNIEGTEARNVDLGGQIRATEINIKEREDGLYSCKKDIENQQYTNTNMRGDMNDYLAEKEALDRHSRILLGQNDDLTKELERFVNTDEVLRQQLDRRGRVYTMQDKNNQEIGYSSQKIQEVRSRSPAKPNYAERSSFYGNTAQTAATTGGYQRRMQQESSPPRKTYNGQGSPLRSSYKPTYKY